MIENLYIYFGMDFIILKTRKYSCYRISQPTLYHCIIELYQSIIQLFNFYFSTSFIYLFPFAYLVSSGGNK